MQNQKKIEQRSLYVGSAVNLLMAAAGFWVFFSTGIQALFLDGFFSFIGFASSLMALLVSRVSHKKTKSYPDGRHFLEPLYAVLKSVLTLGLLLLSVIATAKTAYAYFAHGEGAPMHTGPVLPYTAAMVVLCFGLGFYNRRQNRKIYGTSTILRAESKANMVDGVLSLGVGVAIVLLQFAAVDGPLGFLHYTGDFFITTALVLLSVKPPAVELVAAFKELSGGATQDRALRGNISRVVAKRLQGICVQPKCDIFKVGMHIRVRVALQCGLQSDAVRQLEEARKRIVKELQGQYEDISLEYSF